MNMFMRVMVAVGLFGCLFAGAAAKASDAQQLWNKLLRGCDKTAALNDIERAMPMVAPGYEYQLKRDIYAKHLCSERELKADLEAARRDNEAMARAPSATPACGPASLQNCTCGPQLTTTLVQRINRDNPVASDHVKYLMLRGALELMGCIAPRPAPPPSRNTLCIDLGGGMITCNTQ